jgi:DhnA family fructose-bisphosphate aldolase class Ia
LQALPYLIHISGSSSLGVPLRKVLVADVRECVELGATGVSIQVNLGNKYEPYMMEDLGRIARDCQREGMPLLAMMYVRDQKHGEIVNDLSIKSIAHAARVAYELGADIVKVNYTGNAEEFKQVVSGCQIPVVIAGGSKLPVPGFLEMIGAAMSAGAAGVSCGRNVFQADDVAAVVKSVCEMVHRS